MAPAKPRHVNPFDPQALLDAQRRNFEAFTSAGEIVVDGMRAYAERQAAMVQETMAGLWGELRAGAAKGAPGVAAAAAAAPGEQVERIRAAFDKVVAQVQELSNLLIKVQGEALAVLNACAVRNLETLGAAAPDFSDLQARATAAFETANRETTAVVDEMRRRMATLESRADGAAAPAPAAEPAPPRPAPPRPAAPERAATVEAAERPAPEKQPPAPKKPPAAKAAAASGERRARKPAAAKAPAAPRARRGGGSGGAKAPT